MTLQFTTIPDTRDGGAEGATISAVHVETSEDIIDLRDNHEDWHEGALSVATFPTAPACGYLNHDGPPRGFGGIRFWPGATIGKDNASNFFLL